MDLWSVILWSLIVLAAAAGVYGLHRLCLWLEVQGLLFYKHRQSGSSAAGCFMPFQVAIEPRAQYVMQVEEEKRHHSDDEAPGEGDSRCADETLVAAPRRFAVDAMDRDWDGGIA